MLVQFTVKNFKSFRDKAKLSLVASRYDKDSATESNLVDVPTLDIRLLKSAAIYGANASGKSKLVEALGFMRHFILRSSGGTQLNDKIPTVPFRLNPDAEQAPSEFELTFLHEGELFRYGFEVTTEKVMAEWLYHRPKTKEIEVFYRDGQSFNAINPRQFKTGLRLAKDDMIRPNALMLSVAAQFNDPLARRVFAWLARFNVISGLQEEGYEGFTVSRVMNNEGRSSVMDFLAGADLGIADIRVQPIEHESELPGNLPPALRERLAEALTEKDGLVLGRYAGAGTKTLHRRYDTDSNGVGMVEFDMEEESSGTQKYYALSGPILETLQHGATLVVDELESKLHPNLVRKIVGLFHSLETNPHNAQLIFNTHDSNLLSAGGSASPMLRRDQIWFVSKDRYGASSLYPLSNFKTDTVRKNDDYRQKYLQGRFGAIPFLNNYEETLSQSLQPVGSDE